MEEREHKYDVVERVAHGLASGLLTAPLNLTTATDDFFHPQPYSRSDTCRERYEALQRPAKHLSNHDDGNQYSDTEPTSSLLERREHRFITDGRGRVKEYVGFLAMDRNVRGTAFGDRIWRCGDILLFLVLRVGLRRLRFDGLRTRVSCSLRMPLQIVRIRTVSFPRLAFGTDSCKEVRSVENAYEA